MNQTITAPNAPAVTPSNAWALSGADRTLLIQASLNVAFLIQSLHDYCYVAIIMEALLYPEKRLQSWRQHNRHL